MQNNQNDRKKLLHAVWLLQNPLQQDDDLHIPPREYARFRNGCSINLTTFLRLKTKCASMSSGKEGRKKGPLSPSLSKFATKVDTSGTVQNTESRLLMKTFSTFDIYTK